MGPQVEAALGHVVRALVARQEYRMTQLPTLVSVVGSSFLASIVEIVEAFTIILAVSIVRGWRPAIIGTAAALALLAVAVVIFGPILELVPIHALQFTIGILTLLFGLRWLRKAILRSIGVIAMHDEDAIFTKEANALTALERQKLSQLEWIAGMTAFKAVLLEGLEVIFIVIALGSTRTSDGGNLIWEASLGALAACVLVLIAGAFVHKPLSTVPENTLKYAVGIMLSAFGVFWTGESFGIEWPGADLSIIGFGLIFFAIGTTLVNMYRPRYSKSAMAGAH